jgi:hypothetical protein
LDRETIADSKKVRGWYHERSKQWDSLVERSGRPRDGLLLEARLVKWKPTSDAILVLSLKNVSAKPCTFSWIGGGPFGYAAWPEVLVRDESGELVQMTAKGLEYYCMPMAFGGSGLGGAVLSPGCAWSEAAPIGTHFCVRAPGRYTVLASAFLSFSARRRVVARPVILEIPDPAGLHRAEGRSSVEAPPRATKSVTGAVGDNGWSDLLGCAGRRYGFWELAAAAGSSGPDDPRLVVSLMYLGPPYSTPDHEDTSPHRAGVYPSTVDIILRDPDGAVARHTYSPDPSPERAWTFDCNYMRAGEGIGGIAALGELFDLSKKGDYTALAALPTADAAQRMLVSQPVKFTSGGRKQSDTSPGNSRRRRPPTGAGVASNGLRYGYGAQARAAWDLFGESTACDSAGMEGWVSSYDRMREAEDDFLWALMYVRARWPGARGGGFISTGGLSLPPEGPSVAAPVPACLTDDFLREVQEQSVATGEGGEFYWIGPPPVDCCAPQRLPAQPPTLEDEALKRAAEAFQSR